MSKIFDKIKIDPESKKVAKELMDKLDRMHEAGFVSRFSKPLPKKDCRIEIIKEDFDGENRHLCDWKTRETQVFTEHNTPGEGYLGTARVIDGNYKGIGFHAWEQNIYEFEFYRIIDEA